MKPDKELLIWVKWTKPFEDEGHSKCFWSAEAQSNFLPEAEGQINQILSSKEVWPWPGKSKTLNVYTY